MSQLQNLPQLNPIRSFATTIFRAFEAQVRGRLPHVAAIAVTAIILGACETKDPGIVDTVGKAPELTTVTLAPSRINSDTINVGAERKPEDLLTISTNIVGQIPDFAHPPSRISYSIISSDSQVVVARGALLDDGKGPDESIADGYFSGRAAFQIRRVQIGSYLVEVSAESHDAYRSNTIIVPLTVFRGNQPPVISDLQAPDTLRLGNEAQVLLLSIRASDPDGLSDIAKVLFNSFKPDRSASGSNPFHMYDDGSSAHGDAKASDGIFSLLVSLPTTTQVGTYKFEFQAYDRSNVASNIITLQLVVKP